MKVLIGCPIYKREWILSHWFDYIEKQSMPLSDVGFVFELGPNDEHTSNALWDWQSRHPEVQVFDAVVRDDIPHHEHPKNGRHWNPDKYEKMVMLRNSLLDRVISYQPERFFSLDSDILLEDPFTLDELYERTETLDAVSPLTYMKPNSIQYPSVMDWMTQVGGRARRWQRNYPIGKMFRSDIIMAAVMMTPPVYNNVKYRWHKQGEDLGWSADATTHGFALYCASDIYGAHIMHASHLEPYLLDGDPRSTNNVLKSPV